MIVNLPRSHLINGFLRKDHHPSPSCGIEPGALHLSWSFPELPKAHPPLGCPLPIGQVTEAKTPCEEELYLHHELQRIRAPAMLVSVLAVGVDRWLKGESWSLALAEGGERDVQGKLKTESGEVSVSMTLKILGQDPTVRQSTWGHSAVSPPVLAEPAGVLLQTPLGGSCSLWSLSAALGTQAACECVRPGGVEDAVAVKGML